MSQLPAATVEIVDPTESENDTPAEEPVLSPIPIDIGRVGKGMSQATVHTCSDCVQLATIVQSQIEEDPQGQYEKYANLASQICFQIPRQFYSICKSSIEDEDRVRLSDSVIKFF